MQNLAITLREAARGMEVNGLCPIELYRLGDAAADLTIEAGDLVKLIDEDYQNEQDGKATAELLISALLSDAHRRY